MPICRPYIYVLLWACIAGNLIFAAGAGVPIAHDRYGLLAAQAICLTPLVLRGVPQDAPRWMSPAHRAVELYLLMCLLPLSFRILDALTKTVAAPLADAGLAGADAVLGLDWLPYLDLIHALPALHIPLELIYNTLQIAALFTLVGLLLVARPDRARALAEAFVVVTLAAVLIGTAFPAHGPFLTQLTDPSAYPQFTVEPGTYHVALLDKLRGPPGSYTIGTDQIVGLTTLPSLHTATGVLLILAARGTRVMIPVLAYTLPMLIATPVWGGHYFVDMIAGAALAVAVYRMLEAPRTAAPRSRPLQRKPARV